MPVHIKEILDSDLSNDMKLEMIREELFNSTSRSMEEFQVITAMFLDLIKSSKDKLEDCLGWNLLNCMIEERQDLNFYCIMKTAVLKNILTDVSSSQHVIALLAWCIHHGATPQDVMETLEEHLIPFVSKMKPNVSDVVSLVEFCEGYPNFIPSGTWMIKLCEEIIVIISHLVMPKEPALITPFLHDIGLIENFLRRTLENPDKEEIMFNYLKILYKLLASCQFCSRLSPALACILQLAEKELIPKFVEKLFCHKPDDVGMTKIVTILCEWIIMWPRATNTSLWIIAFITALVKGKNSHVVYNVAYRSVGHLLDALQFPIMRRGAEPVLWFLLTLTNCNPDIFHQMAPKVPLVMYQLRQENTKSSLETLQNIINQCTSLMQMYPGYPELYNPIRNIQQIHCQGITSNCPSSQFPIQSIATTSQERTLKSSGVRVGLKNLGNTCYINSVLQALFMTRRFCWAILNKEDPCQQQPVLYKLQVLFALLLHSRRPFLSPTSEISLMRPSTFYVGRQQDSYEFLLHVWNILEIEDRWLRDDHNEQEVNQNSSTSKSGGTGDSTTFVDAPSYCIKQLPQCTRSEGALTEHLGSPKSVSLDSGIKLIDRSSCSTMRVSNCLGNADSDKNTQDIKLCVKSNACESCDEVRGSGRIRCITEATDIVMHPVVNSQEETINKKNSSFAGTGDKPRTNNRHDVFPDKKFRQDITGNNEQTSKVQRMSSSIVSDIFGGEFIIRSRCLDCNKESSHTEPFSDIHIAFPCDIKHSATSTDLQELIDLYFMPDNLQGESKYDCAGCGGLRPGVRITKVTKAPPYLVLIMKVFAFDSTTLQRSKLKPKVVYSESVQLEVDAGPQEQVNRINYNLYAAIVHSGRSVDSGHYYTYARDEANLWFLFNDEDVSRSSLAELTNSKNSGTPYILFYACSQERLQSAIGISPLSDLRPNLVQIVNEDNLLYAQEQERKLGRISKQKNKDDDHEPPSSCGGSMGLGPSSCKFVY